MAPRLPPVPLAAEILTGRKEPAAPVPAKRHGTAGCVTAAAFPGQALPVTRQPSA